MGLNGRCQLSLETHFSGNSPFLSLDYILEDFGAYFFSKFVEEIELLNKHNKDQPVYKRKPIAIHAIYLEASESK